MKYAIRINKRIKYVRIYTITKRVEGEQGALSKAFTKFFMKIFGQGGKAQEQGGWASGKQ
ncbi:MAG: hypothetical protein QXW10_04415 [Candidatus Micrarchaeaceae archaeon]